jgi:tRNA (cmo5U34)-methyltransferase
MPGQWHLDADTYLEMVRSEVAGYDAFQDRIADPTTDLVVEAILDLGSGTGVTALRVLAHHPGASLVGVDASPRVLEHARRAIPAATFIEARLEDGVPEGPFDLVVSAFAIHHLSGEEKARLFERVRAVLRPAGRFVFCDVVVPERPVATPIPLEVDVDRPDTVRDQLDWLVDAGFEASVVLVEGDVAILQADRR